MYISDECSLHRALEECIADAFAGYSSNLRIAASRAFLADHGRLDWGMSHVAHIRDASETPQYGMRLEMHESHLTILGLWRGPGSVQHEDWPERLCSAAGWFALAADFGEVRFRRNLMRFSYKEALVMARRGDFV